MADILLSSLDADGILRLTMNDGARRNPFSEAMLDALRVAFDRGSSDLATRGFDDLRIKIRLTL